MAIKLPVVPFEGSSRMVSVMTLRTVEAELFGWRRPRSSQELTVRVSEFSEDALARTISRTFRR